MGKPGFSILLLEGCALTFSRWRSAGRRSLPAPSVPPAAANSCWLRRGAPPPRVEACGGHVPSHLPRTL